MPSNPLTTPGDLWSSREVDAHNLVDLLVHDERLEKAWDQAREDVSSVLQRTAELEESHPAHQRLQEIVEEVGPSWWGKDQYGRQLATSSHWIALQELLVLNQHLEGLPQDMAEKAKLGAMLAVLSGALAGSLMIYQDPNFLPVASGITAGGAAGASLVGAAGELGLRMHTVPRDIEQINALIDQALEETQRLRRIREDFDLYWSAEVAEGAEPQAQ